MSKKKERKSYGNQNQQKQGQQTLNLSIKQIQPITATQVKVFEEYSNNKHLCLTGYAGTGKTFIATALGLEEILGDTRYKKFVIIRSVVPSRDMGFLPGSAADKAAVYETPHENCVNEIFGRGDAYQILKQKKIIQFETTSFIRGRTISNAIILVDEIQNLGFQELDTIMTRVGENCRIIFSGDVRQTDLGTKSGFAKFTRIIKNIDGFAFIEFGINDIVRSGIVKSYIIEKEKVEDVYS